MVEETEKQYRAEVQAKREAQKDLRLHRAASQEQCKRYDGLEKELETLRSNKDGYIKRCVHQQLVEEHEKLKESAAKERGMMGAWKSQCGRFLIQKKEDQIEIEKVVQLKTKFEE